MNFNEGLELRGRLEAVLQFPVPLLRRHPSPILLRRDIVVLGVVLLDDLVPRRLRAGALFSECGTLAMALPSSSRWP